MLVCAYILALFSEWPRLDYNLQQLVMGLVRLKQRLKFSVHINRATIDTHTRSSEVFLITFVHERLMAGLTLKLDYNLMPAATTATVAAAASAVCHISCAGRSPSKFHTL